MKPTRRSGLIVQEVDGEFLVYDSDSNVAAALNAPATAVFQACDGEHDVSEIISRLAGAEPPLPEEAVRLALAELAEAGLIDDAPTDVTTSRRSLLLKLGAAAALTLPAVELIRAPGVAAVNSGPTPTPEPTPRPTPKPTTPNPTPGPTPQPTPSPTTPQPTPSPTTPLPTPSPTTPRPTTPEPTPV